MAFKRERVTEALEIDGPVFEDINRGPVHMALRDCTKCHGTGIGGRFTKYRDIDNYCTCVFRRAFNGAFSIYRQLEQMRGHTKVRMRNNGLQCDMSGSDYLADFEIIARKILHPIERAVFHYHFLHGMEWTWCVPYFNQHPMLVFGFRPPLFNRGMFFHAVYRAQQLLGKAYLKLDLYPRGAYLGGPIVSLTQRRTGGSSHTHTHQDPWLNGGYYAEMFNKLPVDANGKTILPGVGIHGMRRKPKLQFPGRIKVPNFPISLGKVLEFSKNKERLCQ